MVCENRILNDFAPQSSLSTFGPSSHDGGDDSFPISTLAVIPYHRPTTQLVVDEVPVENLRFNFSVSTNTTGSLLDIHRSTSSSILPSSTTSPDSIASTISTTRSNSNSSFADPSVTTVTTVATTSRSLVLSNFGPLIPTSTGCLSPHVCPTNSPSTLVSSIQSPTDVVLSYSASREVVLSRDTAAAQPMFPGYLLVLIVIELVMTIMSDRELPCVSCLTLSHFCSGR
ncbi:hypothetical protein J3R30DRAFT_1805962 [Lentinula aciculospora]|uniref:Uncharacterized protein n=1 Tax=Lentinula aciculospora TaxID=153920 RepID=A0A9W9AK30_9AGAR|nr:hypothetical protein J3R30DRAFT_1805962 [Lentinula aciculospora]